MDTLTLLPNKIPVTNATIYDHLRHTLEQLIHLLLNKQKNIGPYVNESTRKHLLEVAKILSRDTSPKIILPTHNSTSEGGEKRSELHTSEGGK